MGKDALGTRMKEDFEHRTRFYLPRRTYTIIRCDGRAFHTWTRGLNRPFDTGLVEDMDNTAIYLCQNIQGAQLAFVQSDEISILINDFTSFKSDAWFDGNIQKMASISASMATSKFNQLRSIRALSNSIYTSETFGNIKLAEFDSRVFTIPQKIEVLNYLQWRQQDTVRNSISSVAQSLYSHKELYGKNQSDMHEMCFQKGVNWNDFDDKLKRGRLIIKEKENFQLEMKGEIKTYERSIWKSKAAPTFTKNDEFYNNYLL